MRAINNTPTSEQWTLPQLPQDPDPARLGKMLRRTLYYSFAASQGARQEPWLQLAGHMYGSVYSSGLLAEAFDTVEIEQVESMKLKAGHGPLTNNNIAKSILPTDAEASAIVATQFAHYWSSLQSAANMWRQGAYHPSLTQVQRRLGSIIPRLVQADTLYLSETVLVDGHEQPFAGRPAHKPGQDPRKSFIREHVLGGLTVHDPVIDGIVRDVRDVLLGGPLNPTTADDNPAIARDKAYAGLPGIVTAWEKFHPGERFAEPGTFHNVRLPAGVVPTPEFARLQ